MSTLLQNEIDEIMNGELGIADKKEKLIELKKECGQKIEEAIEKIDAGTLICPRCGVRYMPFAWKLEHTTCEYEIKVCDLGPLDPYADAWKTKECDVHILTCPVGHKFMPDRNAYGPTDDILGEKWWNWEKFILTGTMEHEVDK